jgi:hypothetical protein
MGIKSGGREAGKGGSREPLGWLVFFDERWWFVGAKENRKSSPTDKSV